MAPYGSANGHLNISVIAPKGCPKGANSSKGVKGGISTLGNHELNFV